MPDDPKRAQERRHATVIFADISGFTAMSEKLDPEDVTDVMNGCFSMIERIILAHGGTIDKYIGDCVMALFGAAHAIEKAARHAVEASLEIRTGLERYNEDRQLPIPLKVHIGVNTGIVIAGAVGGDVRKDFTVMGDTVNLAARLEDASEKGQVFVGPETYAHTKHDFDYRELEPLSLKGKAKPVPAWEVLGVRERTDLPKLGAATRQISSAFVGRTAELAALRRHIESFLEGSGGMVSIVGDAGIGKSRLLKELADLDLLRDARVLAGRSDSLDSRQSYHAFADLLRDWAQIKHDDTPDLVRTKIEDTAASDLIGPDEVRPFLVTVMGVEPSGRDAGRLRGCDGEALEKLIFKAMTDFVADLSRERPLVLLFEDLHWADLSSIKLLESLFHSAEERRVLFIHASRPDHEETSGRIERLLRDRHAGRLLEIRLEPLSEREGRTLVQNLLQIERLPGRLQDVIRTKGEGNPFFIEEVARILIEEGAVDTSTGRLEVTEKIHEVSIPGTVQEVIAVRFENLGPEAQELLRVASVIGRNFLVDILRPLLSGSDADVDQLLEQLKERQLLEERLDHGTGSVRRRELTPARELRFRHALIQETIYSTLLKRERRDLHGRVANTVEEVCAHRLVDFYGMLAFHHSQAENFEDAEGYLFRAGEEAVRSAASSEALRYFREASRLFQLLHGDGGEPRKRLELEKSLATALMLTGNLDEARPHYDRALTDLGERVSRSRRDAYRQLANDAVRILFRMYVLRGRMSKRPATAEMNEALNLLYNRCRVESIVDPEWFLFDSMYMVGRITTVDPRTVDNAFSQWAGVALLFSYSGLSFDLSRRISAMAATLMREERRGELLTYRLMNYMRSYFEGRWDDPSGVDDELLQQVMRTGKVWDVDTFLGIDAEKQMDLGNYEAAERRIDMISRIVTDYGYAFAETNRIALPAFLAMHRRDLDSALSLVERYVERPEQLLHLFALGAKAKIQIFRNELEDAARTIERAETHLTRINRPTPYHVGSFHTARLHLGVLQLELAKQNRSSAPSRSALRRSIREALRTASVMARIRTEVYRHVGTYHWLRGRQRRAQRWWGRSTAEATRLGARPELGRTYLEIGTRLGGSSGERHLDQASSIFTALGLDWDLQQTLKRKHAERAA